MNLNWIIAIFCKCCVAFCRRFYSVTTSQKALEQTKKSSFECSRWNRTFIICWNSSKFSVRLPFSTCCCSSSSPSSGDLEALKTSIRTRYVARIIYQIFVTSASVRLLEQYGTRLLAVCEKRSFRSNWVGSVMRRFRFQSTARSSSSVVVSTGQTEAVRSFARNSR